MIDDVAGMKECGPLLIDGVHRLIAAMLFLACQDARRGRTDAVEFIAGRYFDHWAEQVGIDAGSIRDELGIEARTIPI